MFLYLLPFLVGILLLANRSAARLDHLVVLSHGIHGLKTDLTYLAQQLRSAGCVVLVSSSNEFLRSQSGIEIGGKNLAQEILTVRNSNPQLKRISIVGNSLGGLYTRYVTKELYDTNSGLIAGLHPHCFLTIATPHLGVRNYTFFDEYGIRVPNALKDLVSKGMGRTGVELLGDDPNLDTNSLLYRMAIEEQFLEPLRAFKRRRLLANLNLDLMVPLGTAAFMTPAEVDWHRQAYSNSYGIVRTIYPTDAIGISNIPGHGGTCVSDSQCDVFGEDYKSKSWQPVDEMIKSLDSLGWEKVIVNFKGILPLAHNQIAALTKFTTIIDGLLGFHEGRYLMRESTEWLTSE